MDNLIKKILVLSDSHGNTAALESIINREEPLDAVIFAGDGLKDFGFINFCNNPLKLFVSGNCDGAHPVYDTDICVEKLFQKNILVFHGHRHNIRDNEAYAAVVCRKMNADICVFGHTHEQYLDRADELLVLNPGSAAQGRYAVITVSGKQWNARLY